MGKHHHNILVHYNITVSEIDSTVWGLSWFSRNTVVGLSNVFDTEVTEIILIKISHGLLTVQNRETRCHPEFKFNCLHTLQNCPCDWQGANNKTVPPQTSALDQHPAVRLIACDLFNLHPGTFPPLMDVQNNDRVCKHTVQ